MECSICNIDFDSIKSLSMHLFHTHKDISKKEYYDKYLKKENEGKCYFCNENAIFFDLVKGYHRICSSKECLGRTRATGTYEFLMYKYGYTEEEAKLEQSKRANDRGKKIKKSLDKKLEENPNFNKERSHQTKEYWIKKGLTENEAEEKVKEIMKNIHNKMWNNRKDNFASMTTKIEYWLAKGYNEEEAKQKLSERQSTFTLEKCIDKYGEGKGKEIFNKRQEKWLNSLNSSVDIRYGYSKSSQVLFYKILEYYDFSEHENIFFATKNEELKLKKSSVGYWVYDFADIKRKKIIEFNSDQYHANPKFYKSEDYPHPSLNRKTRTAQEVWDKDRRKKEDAEVNGYQVLSVWYSDYVKRFDEVLKTCLEFLDIK